MKIYKDGEMKFTREMEEFYDKIIPIISEYVERCETRNETRLFNECMFQIVNTTCLGKHLRLIVK